MTEEKKNKMMMMMIDEQGSFHLVDAERVQKEAPEGEFQLPSKERRMNLKMGDWAYIVLADDNDASTRPGERFWVEIQQKHEMSGAYVGLLHVQLIHYSIAPECGNMITFFPKHIYNILTAEQMQRSNRIYDLMGPQAAFLYQTEGYSSLTISEHALDQKLDDIERTTGREMRRRGQLSSVTYERSSLTNRIPG